MVSLDGSDIITHEWIRGVKGAFEKALNGIRNLVNAGVKPQIIMTLMQKNKYQIESLVDLAEKLGASSVKLNIMQPTERGKLLHQRGENLTVKEIIELYYWVQNYLSKSSNIDVFLHIPLAFRLFEDMLNKKGNGMGTCGIFSIIGVLSDGSYSLCGIGERVPELIFGNAVKDKLEDVWNDSPVLRSIRENVPYRLEGICGNCMFKNICLGSCIAQNYYRTKSFLSPFWFCDESYKNGLFPEVRLIPKECRIKKND